MKLNQIALALAALATAPAAFALTPAQIDSNTVRLWLSGASAPTASVYKGVLTLCRGVKYKNALGQVVTNPGTLDVHLYLEGTSTTGVPGTGGGDRMAYTCTVDTADDRAGSLEGKKLVVFHTIEGGSFNYVTPHIAIAGEGPNTTYPTVNPNIPGQLRRVANIEGLGVSGQCAAGTPATVSVDISGQSNTVQIYRGCATFNQTFAYNQAKRASVYLNPDRPDGGFSDTEYLINKLNLNVKTELADIGSEVPTNIGQVFGVGVSYPLYYRLQQNDVAAGALPASCTSGASATSPNLTLGCQPNLPASVYTTVANSATVNGVTPQMFGATAFPGTAGKLRLHRRVPTSGTQSAANLRFLNKPCASGDPQGQQDPAPGGTYPTVIVTENSSTGGVKTGLTNASNAGEFSMGWLSMENIPTSSEKWAFVKLDNVSPNADPMQRKTAMDGNYTAFYELVAFTADTPAYPAFDEAKALIDGLVISLGNPELTDLPGLFITPLAGADASAANVGKVYREGNSCKPAAM